MKFREKNRIYGAVIIQPYILDPADQLNTTLSLENLI